MFKSPVVSAVDIYTAPVKFGGDSWTISQEVVLDPSPPYAPTGDIRYYFGSGSKLHLPNVEIIGGKAYYLGKEMTVYIFVNSGYPYITAIKLTPNTGWQFGTDANGAYVEMLIDYDIATWFIGPPPSYQCVTAMVYTDWPMPSPVYTRLPPAYISS